MIYFVYNFNLLIIMNGFSFERHQEKQKKYFDNNFEFEDKSNMIIIKLNNQALFLFLFPLNKSWKKSCAKTVIIA